jgi:uncharacterized protein (TIGR02118 family)
MIKLMAIYYQPQEGERFDEEYYVKKHMPFAKKMLPGIVRAYYAKGMPTPAGDKPPVVDVGIFVWEDMELFKQAMSSPEIPKIHADLPNYCTCKLELVAFLVEEV